MKVIVYEPIYDTVHVIIILQHNRTEDFTVKMIDKLIYDQ